MYNVMMPLIEEDPEVLREALYASNAHYLVLCAHDELPPEPSFADRLELGEEVDWLTPVPGFAPSIRVWSVNYNIDG